jgi:hypothetical protein
VGLVRASSDHEWFEERGPRCTLLVYVDDATSRLQELRFAPESTFDYESTRRYLEQHGKPVAFYSDKDSVFRTAHERAAQTAKCAEADTRKRIEESVQLPRFVLLHVGNRIHVGRIG